MEIKRAVQSGQVVAATELVNELDPEILDRNPALHFHLLQLRLIELIRNSKIAEAIQFAQSDLAPRAEEIPQFLKELEKTMTLLAFEMPKMLDSSGPASASSSSISTPSLDTKGKAKAVPVITMPAQIASLLEPSQRLNTAKELNEAILTSQSHRSESKLPDLLKLQAWGSTMLAEKGDFPKWDLRELLEPLKTVTLEKGNNLMNF